MAEQQVQAVNLHMLAAGSGEGAVWSLVSEDLNANLVRLEPGQRVPEHVNGELDVVFVGVAGEATLTIDGAGQALLAGVLVYVPKGTRRQVVAGTSGVAYLTCHRRRRGLMPERKK